MLHLRVFIVTLLSALLMWCTPASALELFEFSFPRIFKAPPEERIDTADLETFLDDFLPVSKLDPYHLLLL